MPAKFQKKVLEAKTSALLALEANIRNVSHLLALSNREVKALATGAKRLHTLFAKEKTRGKGLGTKKHVHTIERFAKRVTLSVERLETARLWEAVMMVTCVEAYLQDLLSAAAKIDIDLMGNSEQVAKYGDVIAADSLDGLAGDLRSRWARNWVADGGPTRWIDRLRRMGAKKVPAHTAPALERLWGVRHVAVHNAGRATADFMKRHPGVVSSEGERVRVGNGDILAWVKLIGEFVDPIDSYFLARYPSLLGDQEGAGR